LVSVDPAETDDVGDWLVADARRLCLDRLTWGRPAGDVA
jgi:hypothetical protein